MYKLTLHIILTTSLSVNWGSYLLLLLSILQRRVTQKARWYAVVVTTPWSPSLRFVSLIQLPRDPLLLSLLLVREYTGELFSSFCLLGVLFLLTLPVLSSFLELLRRPCVMLLSQQKRLYILITYWGATCFSVRWFWSCCLRKYRYVHTSLFSYPALI